MEHGSLNNGYHIKFTINAGSRYSYNNFFKWKIRTMLNPDDFLSFHFRGYISIILLLDHICFL